MKKCAFTLSEVLIVLAVLGVIAAMTIPDLIQDYRERALVTALKTNYSIFEQAIEMAQVDNGPMSSWDIGPGGTSEGALKLYNILKPYLRIEKECGTSSGCFADHYEALFNEDFAYQPDANNRYAKGLLARGVSFLIWSYGNSHSYNWCGYIGVDVNGKAGPNKAGVDLFYFMIFLERGLVPYGQTPFTPGIFELGCEYNRNANYNGTGCAYWAIKHENMDYLRKVGVYDYRRGE